LGESSLLTDIALVMEPSFGDLAAPASSRNRTGFVWHPINEEEVTPGGWKNEMAM